MDTGVKTFRSLTDAVPALKSVGVIVKADARTVLERESCCRVNGQQRVEKNMRTDNSPAWQKKIIQTLLRSGERGEMTRRSEEN